MAPALLILLGVASFGAGGLMGFVGLSDRESIQRLSRVEAMTAGDLEGAALGAEALVEGRLSPANPSLVHDLVLYYRSEFLGFRSERNPSGGSDRRPIWKTVERRLPPLRLETPSGEVRTWGDYSVTFTGSDPVWLSTEDLQPGVSKKYEGLTHGQLVTAVGVVTEDALGRALEIDLLASGSAEQLRSGARSGSIFALVSAAALSVTGLVLVFVGLRLLL